MAGKITNGFVTFLRFLRPGVGLPVSFLSITGYVLFSGKFDYKVWLCAIAIFLLSGTASILNQVMEKNYDARMDRTMNRPVASGKISVLHACIFALLMFIIGFIMLFVLSTVSAFLGLITIIWYLLVYTLLKRITSIAVIPGALTGALVPIIGWSVAGGLYYTPLILFISGFVFIWQVPHFWLLLLIYGKEYEEVGFPTLFNHFSPSQVRRWTVVWIMAACITALLLPVFNLIKNPVNIKVVLISNMVLIIASVLILLKASNRFTYRILFYAINLFMLFILAALVIDKLYGIQ